MLIQLICYFDSRHAITRRLAIEMRAVVDEEILHDLLTQC